MLCFCLELRVNHPPFLTGIPVGEGVLSKIVVFGNKLFANIAGTAMTGAFQGTRDDLVSINSGAVDIESFRNSWRENY